MAKTKKETAEAVAVNLGIVEKVEKKEIICYNIFDHIFRRI